MRFGDAAIDLLRSSDPALRARWSVATSFKTALDSDGPFVQTPQGAKTPAEVLEDYFRGLVALAVKSGRPALKSAVFSIPVGFSARSRARLLHAAESAGIQPIAVVSESTAAYLSMLHGLGAAERVAVVDWGAGTLDVSVLRIMGSSSAGFVIEEQACSGSRIAGDHIDMAIYESIAARARADGRQVGTFDQIPVELSRSVLSECEFAKIALGGLSSHDLVFGPFTDRKPAKFAMTAEDLRSLAAPARAAAFKVLDGAIESSGASIGQFDRIIFVGGCTGIRGFRDEAKSRYGQAATFPTSPEWVVAQGALEVASGHAAYESVQEFGCVLDDGYFLPLTHSANFDGTAEVVQVAATESTRRASLVFAERQAERTSVAGSLSVPLQGHLGEPVHIKTTLRRDLTVGVEAWSQCCDSAWDVREMSIENTRFRFRVKP
jgi:molecular chaperone DnaK (HSP70)